MVASGSAATPARCAGLRRTLQHGWEQGFPLQDSPFQVLARQAGGTVREVLGQCHRLADAGALDAIRVHWSAGLQRVRWRCGVALAGAPPDAVLRTLAALPGVAAWEWAEPAAPSTVVGAGAFGGPALWFEIAARSVASARAQYAQVLALGLGLLCLELEGRDEGDDGPGCACMVSGGPCSDPVLARRCEAGLPLVARPYRSLSDAVQRSEREVLATLRRWQRQGQVTAVGLGAPVAGAESLWSLCALAGDADADDDRAATRARLLAQPGIAEVTRLPGHAQWPYRWLVGAPGAPTPGDALLERALAACGLRARPRRWLHVRRVRLRAAPLLFADDGAGLAGGAAAGGPAR
ncbi:MAG: hypothetical protein KF683_07185 [Rubrivivax sp.]|nr:hypothetical protein [Rubrivivax sp.]